MSDIFIVMLEHKNGDVTYAGKESWECTKDPKAVFSLKSAEGKVRWWKRLSTMPSRDVNLVSISIKPANIQVGAECTKLIMC